MAQSGSRGTTRRDFARTLAVLAVGAPLLPSYGAAAPASGADLPRADEPDGGEQNEPLPETEALMAVVRHRYGSHLTADQFDAIGRGVEGTLRMAERLARIRLRNADEPTFVFSAYRLEG